MDTQQEMQKIVEAAGECWHDVSYNPTETIGRCIQCKMMWPDTFNPNPSPTDLNELFRLAKKLNYHCEIDVDKNGGSQVSIHANGKLSDKPDGQSIEGLQLVDALRKALFHAIEGRK